MLQQLLDIIQKIPLKLYPSTKDWAADYFEFTKDKTLIEKAIFGGFMCQQFSFAFMAGYQAALEKMFPAIAPNELKALCVSEEGGVHPKTINTTLHNNRITGLKTYVTAGSDAAHLLVLCKTDQQVNSRPLLKMVHLHQGANNTEITDFELPFMLEIKHGKLALNDTQIESSQLLEGDGYDQYTKPFRTLEDICVGAAYQSMLLRQAIEKKWDENMRDQLSFNIYSYKNLFELAPADQETIILLSANEQNFENLLPTIELNIASHSNLQFKTDWELNKRVISMSKKLKQLRLAKARNASFGSYNNPTL